MTHCNVIIPQAKGSIFRGDGSRDRSERAWQQVLPRYRQVLNAGRAFWVNTAFTHTRPFGGTKMWCG